MTPLWRQQPTHPIGQLPPFDPSGKELSERPLYFGTWRKGNSHNTVFTVTRLYVEMSFSLVTDELGNVLGEPVPFIWTEFPR